MSEETTTETVLYEIARRHQTGDYIAIPATKAAEKKHGADWFWWFGNRLTGVGFRVQAKKLFSSGRYESLLQKKGDRYGQLKALIDSAKKQIKSHCIVFTISILVDTLPNALNIVAMLIKLRAIGDAQSRCLRTCRTRIQTV